MVCTVTTSSMFEAFVAETAAGAMPIVWIDYRTAGVGEPAPLCRAWSVPAYGKRIVAVL